MSLSSQTQLKESLSFNQMDAHTLKEATQFSYRIILASSDLSPVSDQRAFSEIPNSCADMSLKSSSHQNQSEQRVPPASGLPMSQSTSELSPSLLPFKSCSSKPTSLKICETSTSFSGLRISKDTDFEKCLEEHSSLRTFHSLMHERCPVSEGQRPTALCPTPSTFPSRCRSSIPLPRPPRIALFGALLLAILSLQVEFSAARSVGVCRGIPCANGGRLLVSNSIWGNCRCRCPSGFVGPYCQYQAAYKRSGNSIPSGQQNQQQQVAPRLSRSQTMETIRQHILALAQMPVPSSNIDSAELSDEEDDDSEEIIIDNISRRDADIDLLTLSKLADYFSPSVLDDSEASVNYRALPREHRVWRAKRVARRTPLFWR